MSLRQLIVLARRQAVAILIVFLVVLGFAYSVKKTPVPFLDSGTLVLAVPSAVSNPYYSQYTAALISTGDVVEHWIDGPEGQAALQRAGAGSGFTVSLVNFSDEEYPLFSQPYLTVTASTDGVEADEQLFAAGVGVFNAELAKVQTSASAERSHLIVSKLIGVSGPIIQPGSSKRVYPGILLIGVIAAYMLAAALDKRGRRIGLRGLERISLSSWTDTPLEYPHRLADCPARRLERAECCALKATRELKDRPAKEFWPKPTAAEGLGH